MSAPIYSALNALEYDKASVVLPEPLGPATINISGAVSSMIRYFLKANNVRDNRAAGDVDTVEAEKIAKLSAETSLDNAPAASCSSHCYPAFTVGVASVRRTALL